MAPRVAFTPAHQLSLLVKDGVREFRCAVRQSARHLLQTLQQPAGRQPPFAPQLGQAAQTAWKVLDGIDQLAVDFLTSAAEYRRMNYRMLSVAGPQLVTDVPAEVFLRHFYWTLKHLLRRLQEESVTVREEALFRAWQSWRQQEDGAEPDPCSAPASQSQSLGCARLVCALMDSRPLHWQLQRPDEGLPEHEFAHEHEAVLVLQLVVTAVLAGEIASAYPQKSPMDEVSNALNLASSLVAGRMAPWQLAWANRNPLEALEREFAFVLRHI